MFGVGFVTLWLKEGKLRAKNAKEEATDAGTSFFV